MCSDNKSKNVLAYHCSCEFTSLKATQIQHLDFLKVLRFSFPVATENIKNLQLALRAAENIWARLVGKSNTIPYPHTTPHTNSGADPGFFLGGVAPQRSVVTDWWRKQTLIQNTSCIRKPQVISGRGLGAYCGRLFKETCERPGVRWNLVIIVINKMGIFFPLGISRGGPSRKI